MFTRVVAIGAVAVLLGALAWGGLMSFDIPGGGAGATLQCDPAIRSAFQAAPGAIEERDPFTTEAARSNPCQQPAQDRLLTSGVVAVLALGVWLGARRLHSFRPAGASI